VQLALQASRQHGVQFNYRWGWLGGVMHDGQRAGDTVVVHDIAYDGVVEAGMQTGCIAGCRATTKFGSVGKSQVYKKQARFRAAAGLMQGMAWHCMQSGSNNGPLHQPVLSTLQLSLPWLSQRGVSFGVRPHVKVNMFLPEVTGCALPLASVPSLCMDLLLSSCCTSCAPTVHVNTISMIRKVRLLDKSPALAACRSFGSEGRDRDVEQGYCHIHVPRVHFRWDLDGCRPAGRMLLPTKIAEEAAGDALCIDNMVP
jgi:hypothetical protein